MARFSGINDMSFHGEDIGAPSQTPDEFVRSPWDFIEPEEIDREPLPPAAEVTEGLELEPESPLRVAVQPPAAASFSADAPLVDRDSLGGRFGSVALTAGRVSAPASRDEYRFSPGRPGWVHVQKGAEEVGGEGIKTGGVEDCKLQIANRKLEDASTNRQICNPQFAICNSPVLSSTSESKGVPSRGGLLTIPLICFGIGLIACCFIIPQADANRRLAYQKKLLERDLESIQKQVSVNDEFLKRVGDDSSLTERLAQRQMNVVPAGNRVWKDDRENNAASMSPYGLTIVPKPVALPPYRPTGGKFAALCRDPRSNLYLTGAALMMLAAGLVMGIGKIE
jgi:hypothetical protein